MVSCPESPDATDSQSDSRRSEGALAQQQDPKHAFCEQFGALVKASGLSIRDIAKRTETAPSTLDGWKNGRSLPQERDTFLKVVQALQAAAGQGVDRQLSERWWREVLARAKQARDDRASPSSAICARVCISRSVMS